MFDITFTKITPELAYLCLFTFLLLFITNWNPCTWMGGERPQAPLKRLGFTIGILLFSLFCCVDQDYFHYQSMVWEFDLTPGAKNYGEGIYSLIIIFVKKNYLLFRLITWGSALVLFRQTFRRFYLDSYVAGYVLFSCFFLTFSYARVSLAFAIYFYGLSFLLLPCTRWRFLDLFIGGAFIFTSYFFHHSMAILIIITIVTIMPFNKWIITTLALTFPLVIFYFSDTLDLVVKSFLFDDEISDRFSHYAMLEEETANWKGYIHNVISYSRFYIPITFLCYIHYFKKGVEIHSDIRALSKIMIALTFLSLIFLFTNVRNNILFYRILFMTYIPITILLVYHIQEGTITRRVFCALLLLGMVSQLYNYLYSIYISYSI